YNGIIVTAGGPRVPKALRDQLTVGGHMVIPVGSDTRSQRLLRVTRVGRDRFEEEPLQDVCFVPLVGEDAWNGGGSVVAATPAAKSSSIATLIHERAEPIPGLNELDLGPLLDRIGSSRLVLLGESSHGT